MRGDQGSGVPFDVDPVALLDVLPDPIVIVGTDATLRWANVAASVALGWPREDWLGRDLSELVHPDDLSTAVLALGTVQSKPVGELLELRVRGMDGTYRRVELRGRVVVNLPGVDGIVLSVRDVTDRRRWELAAGDTTALAAVLDALPTIALVLAPDGGIRSTNRAFTRLLGHDLGDVVGRPLTDFVTIASTLALSDQLLVVATSQGQVSFEVEMLCADGSTRPMSLTIVDLVDDGAVDGLVATATDIAELVAARERLRHEATHDVRTGLPNLASVTRQVGRLLADPLRSPVGVVLLDIDQLRGINQRYGHLVGDAVIVEVAERLRDAARHHHLVGRVGGDELAVVAASADPEVLDRIVDLVNWAMRTPIEVVVGGAAVQVRVVVATASVLSEPGEPADALLARADAALAAEQQARRRRR